GPSGCGKTTTLRMVAGFEQPTGGTIRFGDQNVTNLAPEQRNVGMVFQNYALFPHMTVAQNIAYGLQMRRVERAEVTKRVEAMLSKVQLQGLGDRYTRQISGGQQQRTALARALVTNPSVLLLDEPLANLDAKLREEMRFYIRELQREFGITTIYVTHDQSEALVLADRIAVMMDGELHQLDVPKAIYERPTSARVADFIGLANLLPGKVTANHDGAVTVITKWGEIASLGVPEWSSGDDVLVCVRPEVFTVTEGSGTPALRRDGEATLLTGHVRELAYLGSMVDYQVEGPEGLSLRVQSVAGQEFRPGSLVELHFTAGKTWVVGVKRDDSPALAA
ncbi:MAG: ABC transporter ATP-binding protein, partial [Trueperaceae bacterium]